MFVGLGRVEEFEKLRAAVERVKTVVGGVLAS
jgi:hypothetical protein